MRINRAGSLTKILFIIIYVSVVNPFLKAQSLNGLSGYFKTPTAYVSEDGTAALGASIFNKKYQNYSAFQNHVGAAFVTIGYFPRVEISIRITRKINANYSSHVMDRMFSAKFLLVKEDEYLPAFSLGLQNPYSTLESANHFNSTYFTASKSFIFSDLVNVSLTLGRGFDWIKAADHEFNGFFGGAQLELNLKLLAASIIIENDALRWNGALRFLLFKHLFILAGLQGMDAFSAGAGVSFSL